MANTKTHQLAIAPGSFLSKLSFMPRLKTKHLLVCTILVSCGCWPDAGYGNGRAPQAATSAVVASADSHPILVELFTSEGCSSCPPADEFVQKLDTLQPVDGAQLIVLSEHVDYWDHEGWKDPNSSSALTERQRAYVHTLGLSTPYTPQIIVDGADEMRVGDPQQVEKVFQQAAATPKVPVRIGTVSIDPGNPGLLHARVETDANTSKSNADVYLAIALDHVDSQVLRGENGGRRLTHVAVVQQIAKIGKLQKEKSFTEDVQLKLKPGTALSSIRVVAFVQVQGPGKLLGAALWKGARKESDGHSSGN
jgi:hypothetical protein